MKGRDPGIINSYMTRPMWLLVGFIVGVALGFTQIFAPIHEWYHVVVAQSHGVNAQVTGWASSQFDRFDWAGFMVGWYSNVWFGFLIALICSFIGRNSRAVFLTGAGGLGFALVSWGRAFLSYDFNDGIIKYLTEQDLMDAWPAIHRHINSRWTTFGIVVFFIAAVVILVNVLKRKPARARA